MLKVGVFLDFVHIRFSDEESFYVVKNSVSKINLLLKTSRGNRSNDLPRTNWGN